MKIKLKITGIVQGIGFRPFVYNCALSLGITGYVTNTSKGVVIAASGSPENLRQFKNHITHHPPSHAVIDTITETEYTENEEFESFSILQSRMEEIKFTRISPDLMVCEECLSEVLDPKNRRYYYPYINCTQCGPRYTIIGDVPYDRPFTTMAHFMMCDECQWEYKSITNRRFHAQPNACHICGPHLSLYDNGGTCLSSPRTGDEYSKFFLQVARLLGEGNIVAMKGLGGFHLMCDPENEQAVSLLRRRKYREYKPFAVMTKNILQAQLYGFVNADEEKHLLSGERPIVLLKKKPSSSLAASVAPSTSVVGIMLPYTPVHHLLFEHWEKPLIMTSANISDEPIVYSNDDALSRLNNIADYIITGDRDILIRCDDSVTRVVGEKNYMLRRSRGIVPSPIFLKRAFSQNILALGPFQKNTICLGKADQAILSHHIGDLDDLRTGESFIQAIRHLTHIFDCRPRVIAHDLHPDYLSTKFAFDPPEEFLFFKALKKVGIQHHHAHIVSCMADNNISGKVIGVAMDGTGYGPDNTIWGGEIFLADERDYERVAHLQPVPMPGSEAAIKKPWRMALSCLYHVYGEAWQSNAWRRNAWRRNAWRSHLPREWEEVDEKELRVALYQLKNKINAPLTSSCGRLFDSIAALCGLRTTAFYEGQPAIELEQIIDPETSSAYEFDVSETHPAVISWDKVITGVLHDVRKHTDKGIIAARFHNGLIDIIHRVCVGMAKQTHCKDVVLSGGCFMNMYLLERLSKALVSSGLSVYIHSRVPCNDGGISLGQAIIADAIVKGE
ncbi:MAG: carbamoyltransferase HypF [Spirochaetales bacterium]|nr:carbamoyltransferase HypF [Spirochaetales bacterium]